jgi:hypothetical protein
MLTFQSASANRTVHPTIHLRRNDINTLFTYVVDELTRERTPAQLAALAPLDSCWTTDPVSVQISRAGLNSIGWADGIDQDGASRHFTRYVRTPLSSTMLPPVTLCDRRPFKPIGLRLSSCYPGNRRGGPAEHLWWSHHWPLQNSQTRPVQL